MVLDAYVFNMKKALLLCLALGIQNARTENSSYEVRKRGHAQRSSLLRDGLVFTTGVSLLLISTLCFKKGFFSAFQIMSFHKSSSKGSWYYPWRKEVGSVTGKNSLGEWENFLSEVIAAGGWNIAGLLVFKLALWTIRQGFD
jgi:hypothetical protein